MPEGPEVTIIRKSLDKLIKNKTLLEIEILKGGKYEKKSPDNYKLFTEKLPLKVKGIFNKGKLMFWEFSNGMYMINHLNMTGYWSINVSYKHSALRFNFKENNLILYYTDVRRFGRVEFLKSKSELNPILKKLGSDIINDDSFTINDFISLAEKKKKQNITKFLMDQSNVSGIGNYMKAEILYRAKISPLRTVDSLSQDDLKNIYKATKKVAKSSLEWGGMSKSDYRDVDGKKGDFESLLKVYCKKKDPLGNPVSALKTKDGRTTYWVEKIQS